MPHCLCIHKGRERARETDRWIDKQINTRERENRELQPSNRSAKHEACRAMSASQSHNFCCTHVLVTKARAASLQARANASIQVDIKRVRTSAPKTSQTWNSDSQIV